MSQTLYKAPIGLMTTFLVFLVVCGDSVENRPSTSSGSSHRKPPFNGSIFGKRSSLPPLVGGYGLSSSGQTPALGTQSESGPLLESQASAMENLATLMLQQESLTRAAIEQCIVFARFATTTTATMTTTPVSLDESLNGSWSEINSASQIQSPIDEDSDFTKVHHPSYSIANSVISFQVERFLQEAQRNQNNITSTGGQPNNNNPTADDLSGIYQSDSDTPVEGLESLFTNLRKNNNETSSNNNKINDLHYKNYYYHLSNGQGLSKSGECLADQLSDSLSLLSRASGRYYNPGNDIKGGPEDFNQDFEWLWDWTAQPEYFTGQEWKVNAPKQDYIVQQRHSYYDNLNKNHHGHLFSGEVMSLLFLTNILSIIIGAGLTYGIMMRKSTA